MRRVIKNAEVAAERYRVEPAPESRLSERFAQPADAFATDLGDGRAPEPVEPSTQAAAQLDLAREQAFAMLQEARERANALVEEARSRAEAMIDEAAEAAAALREQARRDGHDAGYAEGRHAVETEMRESAATLNALLDAAREGRRAYIEAAESEIVRLAMAVAARVVHREIESDPRVVLDVARAAIARLMDKETMVLRVNPADLETIRAGCEDLFPGDPRQIRFVGDLRVDRGGVVVDTEAGSVDAKIEHQLNEARKVLHLDEEEITLDRQVSPSGVVSHAEAS